MVDEKTGYRREFLTSVHHVLLGLCTLGTGVLASAPGRPWPLLVGAAAFVLGWIYAPDLPLFRRHVESKRERARAAAEAAELEAFRARVAQLVQSLSPSRKERYVALTQVCRDIERSGIDGAVHDEGPSDPNHDLRLRKIEELVWTYLRLLSIEEAQERFLEVERRENLPRERANAEAEARELEAEVVELRRAGASQRLEQKERLLGSVRERLDVLERRVARVDESRENLRLIASEQERLVQQVKLIRADAVARKNAESLSQRIDATIEHLEETNRWLAGLEEFKDLVGGLPPTERRIGLGALTAPAGKPSREPEPRSKSSRANQEEDR